MPKGGSMRKKQVPSGNLDEFVWKSPHGSRWLHTSNFLVVSGVHVYCIRYENYTVAVLAFILLISGQALGKLLLILLVGYHKPLAFPEVVGHQVQFIQSGWLTMNTYQSQNYIWDLSPTCKGVKSVPFCKFRTKILPSMWDTHPPNTKSTLLLTLHTTLNPRKISISAWNELAPPMTQPCCK